jgi:short-subunit dehydrogenase
MQHVLPAAKVLVTATYLVLSYYLFPSGLWFAIFSFLFGALYYAAVDLLVKRLPVTKFKPSVPLHEWPKSCALVTGASCGLGYEYAQLLAADGHDLVLVARSESKLDEIKKDLEARYGVNVKVIAKDLSQPGAARAVFDEVQRANLLTELLVNNAGVGAVGDFTYISLEKNMEMVQLNIVALTELTHLVVRRLLQEGKPRGKVMNISSCAGFVPGPGMAVYFATKAYVTSFTEALAHELSNTDIGVSTICPGPTATNFAEVAGNKNSFVFKSGSVMSAKEVAESSYRAWLLGEPVYIAGVANAAPTNLLPFLPRFLVGKIVAFLNKPTASA